MTPEIRQRIELFRQKQLAGTITLEELREALALLREGREAAIASRNHKAPVTTESLQSAIEDF